VAGYVYLIGSPAFCWYKIGKSTRPDIRVKHLGVLLPFKIEVIAVWRAEHHHALEALLHVKYTGHRINGEWFSFDRNEVLKFLAEMPESMETLASFTNVEKDRGPGGTLLKVVRKPDLTDAEREERKQRDIAEKASRDKCPSCHRRLPPKNACS
jgi:Meiotically Up-regulated Gene 113 (MUG113) protein